MTARPLTLTALALLLGTTLYASSAEAMYCGTRLVDRGDSVITVLDRCGEPAHVARRVETRSSQVGQRIVNGVVLVNTVSVQVEVEEWTYDFGAQRFMRTLVFEGGRLVAIHTLGYGTTRGQSPPP